ncbi:MAG: peptidylprolyl isomerase [Planctomycetota bacterium]
MFTFPHATFLANAVAMTALFLTPFATAQHSTPSPQPPVKEAAAEPTAADNSPPSAPASDQACVVIDGQNYSVREFEGFLASRFGPQAVSEFVDHLLLQREALRLEVHVSNEAINTEVERRIAGLRTLFPGGDVTSSLGQRRTDLAAYRHWLGEQVRSELTLSQCISKRRTIDEGELTALFQSLYGPDGQARQIRHILVSPRIARVPVGQIEKAQEILAQITAGADFAELALKHSQDPNSAKAGGTLSYRPGALGIEFDRTIAALAKPGAASLAQSPLGLHVVQLVALQPITFDEARPALLERYQQRPPTPTEIALFFKALREQATITLP